MNEAATTPSNTIPPLPAGRLFRPSDLSRLAFVTTAELAPIDGLIGQSRALEAIAFGSKIDKAGFNLFVISGAGVGTREAVKAMLAEEAREGPSPSDWIYVNNFARPDRPIAIELPSGRAARFKETMHKLIDDLKGTAPAAFQSEDYQTRRSAIDEAFQKKQFEAFNALWQKAADKSIPLLRTPVGFAMAPAADREVVPPDRFNAWPEDKRAAVRAEIAALEKELEHVVRQMPMWDKQRRDEVKALDRQTAKFAVDHLIEEVHVAFADLPRVAEHIEAVGADLIENVPMFITRSEGGEAEPADPARAAAFERYEVNLLIPQNGAAGAPLVEELHPTLGNLIGRIDYVSAHGVLITNFLLVKPGAVDKASGGFLLLDARALLMEPFSWAALKRTLKRGEIAVEDVGRFLGLASTVSLEPDPIPLKVKIVLFGDRLLYFLLFALDPELSEHFKVLADFEDDFPRTPDNEAAFARLVGSIVRREGLRPLERDAVGRTIEHAARLADHSGKLSLKAIDLREALVEADFCAGAAGCDEIRREDVERALQARVGRASRLRDRARETIIERVALIDTEGARVGQVNGLSVIDIGGFAFGRPTRITCRDSAGRGEGRRHRAGG